MVSIARGQYVSRVRILAWSPSARGFQLGFVRHKNHMKNKFYVKCESFIRLKSHCIATRFPAHRCVCRILARSVINRNWKLL